MLSVGSRERGSHRGATVKPCHIQVASSRGCGLSCRRSLRRDRMHRLPAGPGPPRGSSAEAAAWPVGEQGRSPPDKGGAQRHRRGSKARDGAPHRLCSPDQRRSSVACVNVGAHACMRFARMLTSSWQVQRGRPESIIVGLPCIAWRAAAQGYRCVGESVNCRTAATLGSAAIWRLRIQSTDRRSTDLKHEPRCTCAIFIEHNMQSHGDHA